MQVYLVGGAVRDTLLERPVTERDYVVVGATPAEMLAKGFTQVGKDFPVFLHPKTGEEYALARIERKSGAGYTGFVCDASSSVTLEEDLKRRDLTVNAMALDDDGNIIDPYKGQQDIENRCLRHVSAAFSEDPLRVFRVARFATRYRYLGFTIAPETLTLMQSMANSGELRALSAERVWQETKRSLLEATPDVFFTVLAESQALTSWFSELGEHLTEALACLTLAASPLSVSSEEASHDKDTQLTLRFSALCSPLNPTQVSQLCSRLKVPNQVSDLARLLSQFKQHLLTDFSATDSVNEAASALLKIFNGADAWRRPERFSLLLTAMTPLAKRSHLDWSAQTTLIQRALSAANDVNVQDIIATGIKGPAIKQALNDAKCSAIAQAM